MREILRLFPTMISVSDNFISEKERCELFLKIIHMDYGKHGSLMKNSLTTYAISGPNNENFIPEDVLVRLKEEINQYSKLCGYGELIIQNIWVNIQKKGSFLLPHRHPQSKISGCLYINTDEKSSELVFFSPNPYSSFDYYENENGNNFNMYRIKPKRNQLILFPSWIEHGSFDTINDTDDRIVISFNANYK